jgi:hypothetical protein
MPKAKRPAGSLPSSKPPPARHHPGARSARRSDCCFILSRTSLRKEEYHVVASDHFRFFLAKSGPGFRHYFVGAENAHDPN